MNKTLTTLAATVMLLASGAAQADVITFEGIAPTNGFTQVSTPNSIVEGDARLTVSVLNGIVLSDGAAGANSLAQNGTDYYFDQESGAFEIDTVSGDSFDLVSFDFADAFAGGDPLQVALTATYFGGGTFSETLTLSSAFFVTQTLSSNYLGLASVMFDNIAPSMFPAFDNIVLNIDDGAPPPPPPPPGVPSPGALALLGFGIVGLRTMKRRTA